MSIHVFIDAGKSIDLILILLRLHPLPNNYCGPGLLVTLPPLRSQPIYVRLLRPTPYC